jgi:phenylalanyl-tRNA synthetase beta chain
MKVPLSWLREFVDVPASADEVAATMSVRGFAVEGLERVGDDVVIDFEVTGNRPDCMSIVGMAREIAAAYRVPLNRDQGSRIRGQQDAIFDPRQKPGISITIENLDLCGIYAGAVAAVTVRPSPDWMQARLKACGIRPISNIVDITNYVLLELGQPMHAFDHAKLGGGQIRVRTARAGERLKTLDGQDRILTPDMLVIADAGKAVAVAGVMGGGESEVTDSTRTIVFESAYFNPLSVRRTSRALGLKTEASTRFERGADPLMPEVALARACALLEAIGAGAPGGAVIAGGTDWVVRRSIPLRRERIAAFLGLAVPDSEVRDILERLELTLQDRPDGWMVSVPPRRVDLAREVDLIEEVARHHGFDRIPSTFPPLRSAPPPPDPRIGRTRRLRHVMTGIGFSEAVTFGFTSERAALPFVADSHELVRIKNPLSEAFAVMRPSLLPGLIESASINARRGRPDVRLFETGSCFRAADGERQTIAFVWCGVGRPPHWSEKPRPVDLFDAKGAIDALVKAYDVDADFSRAEAAPACVTPGKTAWLMPRPRSAHSHDADVMARPARPLGFVGELAGTLVESFDVPAGTPVYVAELDCAILEALSQPDVALRPVPRFPAVVRDVSILLDDRIEAGSVRATIAHAAGDILEDIREFDRYQGKGIPEDKFSLSLRLTFRSLSRTLTDAEVQGAMENVLGALNATHGAIQR